jgi:uncharacterized protein (DUF302 family)
MQFMRSALTLVLAMLCSFAASPALSADEFGIFETIHESSLSFEETTEAVDSALQTSGLLLHGSHVVRVPDDDARAKVYVLTSPGFAAAASAESPRTVSAQILRIAVYTWGEEQKTYINMANPVAHAMVFYAGSSNYDALISAATGAADELRQLVTSVPGSAVSVQAEPIRTEKHYNKYKGDGPARMMAKFRTWKKSQLQIDEDTAENFDAVVARVTETLAAGGVSDASETTGWETIAKIQLRDDVVYLGLTNPFIEDRMVRINSRFRNDGKSDTAPYPGVDHVAALPTEVLIVKDGDETLVLHYGQMWRMQLYFWDSGYRAFTANVGVPSAIANSIEEAVTAPGK